jgi:glycyl-tRNA synthetase beta chain
MPDLLIELFSEEIPARMQARAAEDLKKLMTDGLVEAGLTYASAAAFATPRRLALTVDGLLPESPTLREERKGPRVDAPVAALDGFLRSTGLTKGQLEARDTGKGEVWFAVVQKPGRKAAEIVAEVLERTVRDFPWPKSMRWGSGSLRWVRPLHSILCVLSDEGGAEVVPLEIDGIRAGDATWGHRFMAPAQFRVTGFDDYVAKLKRAFVVLSAEERAEHIWHDATNMAFAQGMEVVEDRGLLAEVAGLVEWPVVLMGEIGEAFLGLPPEVLRTSMKEHQKFFSVRNPKTGRIEKFVTVANRETADHGATILAGNRKVLAARLSDAKFFWENDLRTVKTVGLEGMAAPLAAVTFHNKLGSQADRIARIEALAREIAPVVGASPDLAAEAARVCKADLQSAMVGEFPELQGVMGRYYAEAARLPAEVAAACAEHYSPLGPGDAVPTAPVSAAVALADKIDTLTGFWAIDEKPTGSKDPFALRRAALGVIRLVLENGVKVGLNKSLMTSLLQVASVPWLDGREEIERAVMHDQDLHTATATARNFFSGPTGFIFNFDGLSDRFIAKLPELRDERVSNTEVGVDVYNEVWDRSFHAGGIGVGADGLSRNAIVERAANHLVANLLSFLHDRLKVYLRDRGIRHDVIDAVLAMPGNDDLALLVARAEALADTLKTDDGTNLIQGFKRANNILTQAEAKDGVEYSYGPDVKFAENDVERALFAALDAAEAKIAPAMAEEDFRAAMAAMAGLRGPIDAFFESVVVNAENQAVRRNRLNLLHRIRTICLSVADLTKIEG